MATQTKEFTEICREIVALFESAQSLAEQITSDKTALGAIKTAVDTAQSDITAKLEAVTSAKGDFDAKKAEFDAYYETLNATKATLKVLSDNATELFAQTSADKADFDSKFAEFKANYANFASAAGEFESRLINARAFWATFESDWQKLQNLKSDLISIVADASIIDDTAINSEVKGYSASKINALITAEKEARQTAISEEASARQTAISEEASARQTAISEEASARLSDKTELTASVSNLNTALSSLLVSETAARTDADTAINARISELASAQSAAYGASAASWIPYTIAPMITTTTDPDTGEETSQIAPAQRVLGATYQNALTRALLVRVECEDSADTGLNWQICAQIGEDENGDGGITQRGSWDNAPEKSTEFLIPAGTRYRIGYALPDAISGITSPVPTLVAWHEYK